jgi:hypothetical protein
MTDDPTDPFTRPTWQAAFDPAFPLELEAAAAATPIGMREVDPIIGSHGCGGPEACSF